MVFGKYIVANSNLVKVECYLHGDGVQAVVVVEAICGPGGDGVLKINRLELVQEEVHSPAVQLPLSVLDAFHKLWD